MTDETVVLEAASYTVVCPRCGRTRYTAAPTRFVECECGTMIVTTGPRHRFPATVGEVGVLVVASYRWRCPDCGRTGYVPTVTGRVRCPECGGTFGVACARHNGPQERLL